ncbi:MAG: hypothetical protein V8S24_16435 [Gordonibacter pamelaeae]
MSPTAYAVLGTPLPLAFDLAAWGLSGAGLGCLLFSWMPAVSRLDERSVARCMALSTACGGFLYLVINLLPSYFSIVMLVVCPWSAWPSSAWWGAGPDEGLRIPLAVSQEKAGLSWAFGVIYIVYGIVFGLGAGSITQLAGDPLLFVGIAGFALAGALAALAFMHRFAGRMRQIDVLRMVFPFLVVSLVSMALFTGPVYALSNLLLLAVYVFLVVVSMAFEVHTAHNRHAAPLYFVGMSQGVLGCGMAAGFALGLLPAAAGATNYAVLSGVALGLVVVLAAFITFAPSRRPADDDDAAEAPERARAGPLEGPLHRGGARGQALRARDRGVLPHGEGPRHRAHPEQAVHLQPHGEVAHVQHLQEDGHQLPRGAPRRHRGCESRRRIGRKIPAKRSERERRGQLGCPPPRLVPL